MGQSSSTVRSTPFDLSLPTGDITGDLPDECLALVFHCLSPGDRKRCSLVCRRWLAVEAQSRLRLSLDARAALAAAALAIFSRFDSLTKLTLKSDRRSRSIGDETLALITLRCPLLTRLKLRACRDVTDAGIAAAGENLHRLRKFSCGSCSFGAEGIAAVVASCPLLEDISIKRLRGLTDAAEDVRFPTNSSLKSVSLKELYNGQCLTPLIAGSTGLKTLKIFQCTGDWGPSLEDIAGKVPGLVEVCLEKLRVGDRGLCAFAGCLELEILHLVKTLDCTDSGLSVVASRCWRLRKVHLDGLKSNRIGEDGLTAVAHFCADLQELVLLGINATVLSIGLIAENCRSLERLALCASPTIGDAEISCVASKCLALKKLCIKGCSVSNRGMWALAEGCPNLVKLKVKKCRAVTMEGIDSLRASRVALEVNFDIGTQVVVDQVDASASENGLLENANEQFHALIDENLSPDLPSSSNGRSVMAKVMLQFSTGRNFVACTIRKLSHSSNN